MRRIASLPSVLLLSACAALPSGAAPAADGAEVTLGMGQSTLLADNSLLTYVQLVDDSRCAPGVQCVWEGSAEIALRWQPRNASARDIRLHTNTRTGPVDARVGDRTVTLAGLERGIAPKATLRIVRTR